jgi:putative PIN family toxin of toxin-antitoxin system
VKVFFDTNVLISAFTTRGLSADLFRLVLAEHELLTGDVNLTEFRRVLRQRFRVPAPDIAVAEEQLRAHTIVPKPAAPSDLPVRDADDAWVLASAVAGGADMLVTGDKDLLSIAAKAPLLVVDPRSCWDRLRGRSA